MQSTKPTNSSVKEHDSISSSTNNPANSNGNAPSVPTSTIRSPMLNSGASRRQIPGVSSELLEQLLGPSEFRFTQQRAAAAAAAALPARTTHPVLIEAERSQVANILFSLHDQQQSQMNTQVLAAYSLIYAQQQMREAQVAALLRSNAVAALLHDPFALVPGRNSTPGTATTAQLNEMTSASAQLQALAGMQRLQQHQVMQQISAPTSCSSLANVTATAASKSCREKGHNGTEQHRSADPIMSQENNATTASYKPEITRSGNSVVSGSENTAVKIITGGHSDDIDITRKSSLAEGIPVFESLEKRLQATTDAASESFPSTLHRLLTDLENKSPSDGHDVAYFLPDGHSFIIADTSWFEKKVMKEYFPRMGRYSSFQRQLNFYGFQRISKGPSKGAYFHKYFVKQFPLLSRSMKRARGNNNQSKSI